MAECEAKSEVTGSVWKIVTEVGQKVDDKRAPCFEMPPSLYNGKIFPFLKRGVAPLRANPKGVEGNPPAKDPDPGPND